MDKPHTTPKDFFLWAGAIIAFYWSIIAFIFLLFSYIDYTFPNALTYYPVDPYQSGISFQMASIIILFPVYLALMRVIRGDIARDPSRGEIWVRRWAIIFTLFVAGLAIAGDLVTLLTTFLNGEELTTSFLLKILVIFLVAAGVFMHFIADLRGYWMAFPMRKRYVSIGVAGILAAAIVSGFFIVGTPAQARLARFDAQKVNDLQNIQSQVVSYYQAKRALPANIEDLNNPLMYGPVPNDPQTQAAYGYEATGSLTFKICADFNSQSRGTQSSVAGDMVPRLAGIKGVDNWQHPTGNYCFERTIDPSFYPPLSKVQL